MTAQAQGRGLTFLAKEFQYQTYFSSALLHLAVRSQGVGSGIALDDASEENIAGYGVGLLPSSETPIAVEFKRAGASAGTSTLILKPGQVVYPFGRDASSRFEGVRWGLPYGWLGGGLATLVVITSPDAELDWPKDDHEVVIQRQRMAVLPAATAYANLTWPQNWPTRFPARTTRLAGAAIATTSQSGQPSLHVQPTRTQLSLRVSALAAPATTRFLMIGSEGFDLDNTLALTTDERVQDVTWASTALYGGVGFANQFQVTEFQSGILVGLGVERTGLSGVICLSDGTAELELGTFVDIIRYGRL